MTRTAAWRARAGSNLVALLPELLPAMAVGTAIVCMLLLVCHALYSLIAYPLALIAAVATGIAVARLRARTVAAEVGSPRAFQWDIAALGFALTVALVNGYYASHHVIVDRDPAVYVVTAQWLTHHHALPIHIDPHAFVAPATTKTPGFAPTEGVGNLYAQGMHAAPVLAAMVGRVFGTNFLLRTDALIGALALLAVYAFARLLVHRGFALVAMVGLGCSLPEIHFTRDTYSEPFGQLAVFIGLTLIARAFRDRTSGSFVLAGAMFGGAMLSRTDAFLAVIAAVAVIVLLLVCAESSGRVRAGAQSLAFGIGVAVPGIIGLRDLQRLSSGYYHDLHSDLTKVFEVGLAAVVVAFVVVLVFWSMPSVMEFVVRRRAVLAAVSAALTLVVFLGLMARPLFETSRDNHTADDGLARQLQIQVGAKIDPTRTYAERSVEWIGYYFGPITMVLGFVGVAILIYRFTRRDNVVLAVPFLTTMVPPAIGYFLQPSISIDQIWAARRLLPVVMPGMVIGTVVVLAAGSAIVHRLRSPWRPVGLVAVGGLAMATVAVPLAISWPLLGVREYAQDLSLTDRVCRLIGPKSEVLTIGAGDSTIDRTYASSVNSFCRVPAAELPGALTPAVLARERVAAVSAGRTLWVLADQSSAYTGLGQQLPTSPTMSATSRVWTKELTRAPHSSTVTQRNLYMGRVSPDGSVIFATSN